MYFIVSRNCLKLKRLDISYIAFLTAWVCRKRLHSFKLQQNTFLQLLFMIDL